VNDFRLGQRVVSVRGNGELDGARGTVVRLRRCDDGAWIRLDRRPVENCCCFPAIDPHGRGNDVVLYPEDCDPEPAPSPVCEEGERRDPSPLAEGGVVLEAKP
jgi:hypothetical protein